MSSPSSGKGGTVRVYAADFDSRSRQMADVTRDGALSLPEFCIAMHLVVARRNKIPLPATLPPELLAEVSAASSSSATNNTNSNSKGNGEGAKETWTKFQESPPPPQPAAATVETAGKDQQPQQPAAAPRRRPPPPKPTTSPQQQQPINFDRKLNVIDVSCATADALCYGNVPVFVYRTRQLLIPNL